eukprot:403346840
MSDIYGYLDKKTKEIEELKLKEAKLIKEAKSALNYVKQKVPLPELMEKMHKIETVFPKLDKIQKEQADQHQVILHLKSLMPNFLQQEELQTTCEIVKQDLITYVDEQFKRLRTECFAQLDAKMNRDDFKEKFQFILHRSDFDRLVSRMASYEDEQARIRDVLYMGFKKQAEIQLDNKLDRSEAFEMFQQKYDKVDGDKHDGDIKKMKGSIKQMENIIKDLQDQQRRNTEEPLDEIQDTLESGTHSSQKVKTAYQMIKDLREQLDDLRNQVYHHKDQIEILHDSIKEIDQKVSGNTEKIAKTLKEAEAVTSKLKDVLAKYDNFLVFMSGYSKQIETFNKQFKDMNDKLNEFQNQLGLKLVNYMSENEKLQKRVLFLEREQSAMTQDLESHKLFKRKQFDHLTNEFNELRDFKTNFQKRFEQLGLNLEQEHVQVNQQFDQVQDQINIIKEPLMREIKNMKKENEGLLNEIKRTQNQNREIISDYFKLMDAKINSGNEATFLTSSMFQDQNNSMHFARNSPHTSMTNRTKLGGFTFSTQNNAAGSHGKDGSGTNRKRAVTSLKETRDIQIQNMVSSNRSRVNNPAGAQSQDSTDRKSHLIDFSIMSSLNQKNTELSTMRQIELQKTNQANFPVGVQRDTRNQMSLDKKHLRKKTFERMPQKSPELNKTQIISKEKRNSSQLLKIEDYSNHGMNQTNYGYIPPGTAGGNNQPLIWPSSQYIMNQQQSHVPRTAQHNSRRNVMKEFLQKQKQNSGIGGGPETTAQSINIKISQGNEQLENQSAFDFSSHNLANKTQDQTYMEQHKIIDEEAKEDWDHSDNGVKQDIEKDELRQDVLSNTQEKFVNTLKKMRHNRNQTETQVSDILKAKKKKQETKQMQQYELRRFGHLFGQDQ